MNTRTIAQSLIYQGFGHFLLAKENHNKRKAGEYPLKSTRVCCTGLALSSARSKESPNQLSTNRKNCGFFGHI